MKSKLVRWIPTLLLLLSPCLAAEEAQIFLSIEPVIVRGSTIEPLSAPSSELIPVDRWGAHHQIIRLDADESPLMRYKLEFHHETPDTLRLTLERHLSGSVEQALPVIEKTISVLDAWRTTLLERTEDGRRIDLRVTPVLRPTVSDEPFGESRLTMTFKGGPLVLHGSSAPDDRVIFREVNVGGTRGLRLGVRGVGNVSLSIDPFEGATECGWVRGYRARCRLGDAEMSIWSTSQILPEDTLRPGKGWKLYGKLEPDASMGHLDGFYGSFDP